MLEVWKVIPFIRYIGFGLVIGAVWYTSCAVADDKIRNLGYDTMCMMNPARMELPSGSNARAYVYAGSEMVLATFDSGSFRNGINPETLERLEKNQRENGNATITVYDRVNVTPTTVTGFAGSVEAAYSQAVGIAVTFKENEAWSVTLRCSLSLMI